MNPCLNCMPIVSPRLKLAYPFLSMLQGVAEAAHSQVSLTLPVVGRLPQLDILCEARKSLMQFAYLGKLAKFYPEHAPEARR
jgi:hypothetical protein